MDEDASENFLPPLSADVEELLRLLAADLIEKSGLAVMTCESADVALQLMGSWPDIRLRPFCRRDQGAAWGAKR
jgi:hypothetical protein